MAVHLKNSEDTSQHVIKRKFRCVPMPPVTIAINNAVKAVL